MKVHFLDYISRSGSTILAREINDKLGIPVSIEAKIPDGIRFEGVPIKNIQDLNLWIEMAFSDEKFSNWGLEKKVVRDAFLNQLPMNLSDVYRSLSTLYFDHFHKNVVIKGSSLGLVFDEVINLFPGSVFLFIVRDPRGIFCSQRDAINSETGLSLAKNGIYSFIYRTKFAFKSVLRYNEYKQFQIIKYEEFVGEPKRVLERINKAIGDGKDSNVQTNYFDTIPESQRHLHHNVAQKISSESVDKWKSSLSAEDVCLIEAALGREMNALGYTESHVKYSFTMRISTGLRLFNYWAYSIYRNLFCPLKVSRKLKGSKNE